MNGKRKVSSLFLVLVLLLSAFVALTSAQDAVDWETELGDYSGETLRIIMIQDPWVGSFDEINARFEELTGAEVIIDSFGYDATYEREILNGTAGSSEYDVVVLDSPWVGQFAESGFVDDLTPLIGQQTLKGRERTLRSFSLQIYCEAN